MNTTNLTIAFAGLALMASSIAYAQDLAPQAINAPGYSGLSRYDALPRYDAAPSNDIQSFQKELKSAKKQFIAANIELTEDAAQTFWPIYDRYAAEMMPLLERKFRLIAEYAARFATLTDDEADAYIKGRSEAENAILSLRIRYIPVFRKVLPAKAAALLAQIDWRLDLLVDVQVNSQLPLIEP